MRSIYKHNTFLRTQNKRTKAQAQKRIEYLKQVRELESLGCTTSDAQGIIDAEELMREQIAN